MSKTNQRRFREAQRVCVVDSSVVVDWLRTLGNTAQIRLCCLMCTSKLLQIIFGWVR